MRIEPLSIAKMYQKDQNGVKRHAVLLALKGLFVYSQDWLDRRDGQFSGQRGARPSSGSEKKVALTMQRRITGIHGYQQVQEMLVQDGDR